MIEAHHDNDGLDRDTEKAADRIARALMPHDPVAAVEASKAKEVARQTRILRADRLYAADEAARDAAQLEIRSGVYVSVSDAVVPPTPEWLAMHETVPVTVQADGEGHHARSVKTVRKIIVTPAMRAHKAGKIDDRQFRACVWYRDRHEESGLNGRVASARFNQRIAATTSGVLVFTDRQVEALDDIRCAYAAIDPNHRRFFELVVIEEIGVKRASRAAKCRKDPFATLRTCADAVADWLGL